MAEFEGSAVMAQYAVLNYALGSAHAPDATPEDLEVCNRQAGEPTDSGSMIMAYALMPRGHGDVDPRRRRHRWLVRGIPRKSSPDST